MAKKKEEDRVAVAEFLRLLGWISIVAGIICLIASTTHSNEEHSGELAMLFASGLLSGSLLIGFARVIEDTSTAARHAARIAAILEAQKLERDAEKLTVALNLAAAFPQAPRSAVEANYFVEKPGG
jgi:hypothetical protein